MNFASSRLYLGLTFLCLNKIDNVLSYSLPNSCIGQEDGEYWLQLSTDSIDYSPVKLQCSNEYIILDINKDPNLLQYFSTFEKWHHSIGGPANTDPVTWLEWFLPENQDMNVESKYLISPDCSVCDDTHSRQVHGSESSYWMTGNLAKLHWGVIGFNECDMDYETYECFDCTSCMIIGAGCDPTAYTEDTTDYSHAGICGVTVEPANHMVYRRRKIAQQSSGVVNYKPSIGTNGEFCVCYQPVESSLFELTEKEEEIIESFEHKNEFENKNNQEDVNKLNNMNKQVSDGLDRREEHIIYLKQSDFESGTYRIHDSGTYILSQDIIFDFNKDDDYWPTSSQRGEYPGANEYRDAYHLGFFAGITIECDYVTIDLNSHELRQSFEFYYQQRWFAIIELGNQQFLPGQGPAFFGADPVSVNNIKIIDGTLGLTSHFAIHGNYPTNLVVENVHIKEFVTHGLQLNGWENLVLNNLEIGPSSTFEYLRGDYAHGRILAQRLRAIENNLISDGSVDTQFITFAGRSFRNEKMTVSDVADELDLQMELAFDYAMNRAKGGLYSENDYINPNKYGLVGVQNDDNNNIDENQVRWVQAKKQFVHESGYPSASSITGLFLNFEGASVFSYTMYTTRQSKNGVLNNIYIHDIYHDMVESTRLSVISGTGQLYPTPWNSDIPADASVGGINKLEEIHNVIQGNKDDLDAIVSELGEYNYVGNVMTDAYFAMDAFSDDWGILGFLQTEGVNGDTTLLDWVHGVDKIQEDWVFGCNQDIMGHSGKGLLGIRVDGVSNLELNNIIIENLNEYSKLGSEACGNYDSFNMEKSGGHFKQALPMQWGFSGNDLQAMSIIASSEVTLGNIYINNINNDFSQAFGVSFWTSNDVTVNNNAVIIINNIQAGIKLSRGAASLSYLDKPNRAPEGCAVRLETEDSFDYYESTIAMENNGLSNIFTCNVNGHVHCLGGLDNIDDVEGSIINDDVWTMYGNYYDNKLCEHLSFTDKAESIEWSHYVLNNKRKPDESGKMSNYDNLPMFNSNNNKVKTEVVKKVSVLKNDNSNGYDSALFQIVCFAIAAMLVVTAIVGMCVYHLLCPRIETCMQNYGNKTQQQPDGTSDEAALINNNNNNNNNDNDEDDDNSRFMFKWKYGNEWTTWSQYGSV